MNTEEYHLLSENLRDKYDALDTDTLSAQARILTSMLCEDLRDFESECAECSSTGITNMEVNSLQLLITAEVYQRKIGEAHLKAQETETDVPEAVE